MGAAGNGLPAGTALASVKQRAAMDNGIADDAAAINDIMPMIRPWKADNYQVGDVRTYKSASYKCVQGHDSAANPDWTPDAQPPLWMRYHGTSPETARPWVAPTGAHDVYKVGEHTIWTDGETYRCKLETNFSPADLPAAWEAVTA